MRVSGVCSIIIKFKIKCKKFNDIKSSKSLPNKLFSNSGTLNLNISPDV